MTIAAREIAFIDSSITDWETLLAGLNEGVEVILLDPAADGLRQMADALRDYSDLSAIHLFSHGGSGELILGGMRLNAGNLVDYGDALVTIGNALSETGDILLYGCNVAQGEVGQEFIAQLAAATGADVAASNDLTGNAVLGGNWLLEVAAGMVEAQPLAVDEAVGVTLASGPLVNYKIGEIAEYLRHGYWDSRGDYRSFNMSSTGEGANSGVLYYNYSGFSNIPKAGTDTDGMPAAWRALVDDALDYLGAVLGIQFEQTTDTDDKVDIFYCDRDPGVAMTDQQFHGSDNGLVDDCYVDYAWINITSSWNNYNFGNGGIDRTSYAYQTIINETLHALGLGHAGPYNGGNPTYITDGDPTTTTDSNIYLNDSWQQSIMSYMDLDDNTKVDADFDYLLTPMAADFLALRTYYSPGAKVAFIDDTTYGFNTNISADVSAVLADLRTYAKEIGFCIIDDDGVDTLDFSGYSADQRINLTVATAGSETGSISDIGGLKGNMTLAVGTVIENAVGGSGSDTITGNDRDNTLWGNGGSDTLDAGAGNDMLGGGTGDDTLMGGIGDDIYRYWFGDDNERIFDVGGNDQFWFENTSLSQIVGASQANTNDLVIEIETPWFNDHVTFVGWYGGNAFGIETFQIDGMTLSGTAFVDLVEKVEAGGVALRPAGDGTDQFYYGSDDAETVSLLGGNDRLYGRGGADTLVGGDGNDWLDGGTGADILQGEAGNDTYVVDDAGDVVAEMLSLKPVLVSTNAAGVQGNGSSWWGSLSADGRYVSFVSSANNLVAGDTNGYADVFVKDLQTGTVRLASTSAAGVQANWGHAYYSGGLNGLSADGRYVVFYSEASNLVAGDTNGYYDVFVKDLQSGAIERVSTSATGAQAGWSSFDAQISADGRYVVFTSNASNLVAGDSNGYADVFVKDRQTGAVQLVSTGASGGQGNGHSQSSAFSADGRYVVFSSDASNLVPGDSNGVKDIFVKDLQTGGIECASSNAAGVSGNAGSDRGNLSADGRYVVFGSDASDLVAGDTNGVGDIFVKDLWTGAIRCASTDATGNEGNANSFGGTADISADGRYVVFASYASNLLGEGADTNGVGDIFVKDLLSGAIQRVSTNALGGQGNSASPGSPVFSADDRYVVFDSRANNLVAVDNNGAIDIFRFLNPFLVDGGPGGGTDTVRSSVTYTLPAGVDNLVLTGSDPLAGTGNAGANQLTGNGAANVLTGGDGNDTLIGLGSRDLLVGGTGDDTYHVDLVRDSFTGKAVLEDTINEGVGQGSDRLILETANHVTLDAPLTRLTLSANLETLDAALTGTTRLDLTGNALDNTLIGNAAANVLDGGGGNDRLDGGLGNDTYVVDRASELALIVENAGEGTDTDTLKIVYVNTTTLPETVSLTDKLAAIENATIADTAIVLDGLSASLLGTTTWGIPPPRTASTGVFNLTGNDLDNVLTGNNNTNVLAGGTGNDSLFGRGGGDTLNGGDNDDTLQGGAGGDFLTGGAGNDRFVFTSKLAGDADRITDFTEGDLLVLQGSVFTGLGTGGALAPAAFVNGTRATSTAQQVIYDAATGYLYYDANGVLPEGDVLVATLTNHPALDARDFWVA